jgi:hypothetical protein
LCPKCLDANGKWCRGIDGKPWCLGFNSARACDFAKEPVLDYGKCPFDPAADKKKKPGFLVEDSEEASYAVVVGSGAVGIAVVVMLVKRLRQPSSSATTKKLGDDQYPSKPPSDTQPNDMKDVSAPQQKLVDPMNVEGGQVEGQPNNAV